MYASSPRGVLAAVLSILVTAALVVIPAGATANSHLASERETPSRRIIQIEPAEHAMAAGDRAKLVAQICRADGTRCRPATGARWTFKPRELVFWSGSRGAVVVVESLGTEGQLRVTAKQGNARGTAVVTIGEAVEPVDVEVERDDLFLYVVPEQEAVDLGGAVRLNTWGCPIDTSTELGENGVPDGTDDACEALDIEAVVIGERDPVMVEAIAGPAAVLRVWPSAATDEAVLLTPQLVTAAGVAIPRLTVSGDVNVEPPFWDVDADGRVSAADLEALRSEPVDLNGDAVADEADVALFELLAARALLAGPDAAEAASE